MREALAVHQEIVVRVAPECAFTVFTERIGAWWQLGDKHIGATPPVTAEIEPWIGGRWFERAADGTECPWGHVRVWEPPHRLVLSWEISADWQPDPTAASEVEVRFVAEAGATRVVLDHRGLETLQVRDTLNGGWPGLLLAYATLLED